MTTLILKRNRDLGPPERADYSVLDSGRVVGRIYFGAGADGKKWLWALNGVGSELADTLDEAKAYLKARYVRPYQSSVEQGAY